MKYKINISENKQYIWIKDEKKVNENNYENTMNSDNYNHVIFLSNYKVTGVVHGGYGTYPSGTVYYE